MLGGLSQPRVSQLVKEGLLVVERDPEGRLRYDREATEKLVRNRAAENAIWNEGADERKALQAEARDRLRRAREREAEEQQEKERILHEQRERTVSALEGILECLRSR
jgi:hypothetical protein